MLMINPQKTKKLTASVSLAGLLCATLLAVSSSSSGNQKPSNSLTHDQPSAATEPYPWELELVDTNGKSIQLSDYRGRTLLLSFFYATCGYACPIQTARLAQVQKRLSDQILSASRFISVSIHPNNDTPSAIDAFVRPFDVNRAHWQFGTPTSDASLNEMLVKAGVSTRPTNESGQTDHRMKILLIDPAGRVMQRYVGDKFSIERLATEIETLVHLRSGGQSRV